MEARTRFDVIVVGAGQAGLSVGYHLARTGLRFLLLDAHRRVGDAWRERWDSLRLFTPAQFDGLDGMPFPAPPGYFPTKDEMADYLEAYAARFELPMLGGVRVDRLVATERGFRLEAGDRVFEAGQVVIAMSSFQRGVAPAWADELDPSILKLHSSGYRSPAQLRPGRVLLVGAGNSASEIALELARSHPLVMAGRDTGEVPFRISGFWARFVLAPLIFRVLFHRILTIRTPMGRRARARMLRRGDPRIRVRAAELAAAGVERTSRVAGVRGGRPLLEDGSVLEVANVVFCSGFRPDFSWLELPIFDEHGEPRHAGGIVEDAPGLYFVGLRFLYSYSSAMIHGVGRDAARIAAAVSARAAAARGRTTHALAPHAA
jgi:putative flavoprotein involved in K+ transport